MEATIETLWLVFFCLVSGLLTLDIYLLNKKVISNLTAYLMLGLILCSVLVISSFLVTLQSQDQAFEFLTAYLVEFSLSIDNVFLFFIIFKALKIEPAFQKRILVWGILGAIVMRLIFLSTGIWLIEKASWLLYVFGLVLLVAGYKMLRTNANAESEALEKRIDWIKSFLLFSPARQKGRFFIREKNKLKTTVYFLALLAVELTDLVFAIDSIPAVLAITSDRFVIISSNILAILGLRTLYSLVAKVLGNFAYLHYSLALILIFIGIKTLLDPILSIPSWASLFVILSALGLGVFWSIHRKRLL